MMKINIRFLMILFAGMLMGACQQQREGSMEKAGEKIDDAVDNIKKGENPLKERGPVEKAGEAIDDAVKDVTEPNKK